MDLNNMNDEELAALIDKIADDRNSDLSGNALHLDDFEVVKATQRAIELERKPSWLSGVSMHIKSLFWHIESNMQWNIRKMIVVPGIVAAALVCVVLMVLPSQSYSDVSLARGIIDACQLDSLIQMREYQRALDYVDAQIGDRREILPKLEFFDRFRSEQERYEIALARMEIYELQWKKIEILSAKGDIEVLHKILKDYASISGYHQVEAKDRLNRLGVK